VEHRAEVSPSTKLVPSTVAAYLGFGLIQVSDMRSSDHALAAGLWHPPYKLCGTKLVSFRRFVNIDAGYATTPHSLRLVVIEW
jgi:hypothetical protein